jgi:hypothetical protein
MPPSTSHAEPACRTCRDRLLRLVVVALQRQRIYFSVPFEGDSTSCRAYMAAVMDVRSADLSATADALMWFVGAPAQDELRDALALDFARLGI